LRFYRHTILYPWIVAGEDQVQDIEALIALLLLFDFVAKVKHQSDAIE